MEYALRSFGRKVTAQKMKTAGATGVLALQEHGLKEVPDGLFLLVKLRVRERERERGGRGESSEQAARVRGTQDDRALVVMGMEEGSA